MRCFATRSVAAALGWMFAAGFAMAQGYGSPTLLPLPEEPAQSAFRTNDSSAAPQNRPAPHQVSLANGDEPTPAPERVPSPDAESRLSVDQGYSASPSDVTMNGASGGCADGSCYNNSDCCDNNWISPWCGPNCNCGWFGSVGGMVLNRDNANGFWTSFQSTNNANQIMKTTDAETDWRGGWFVSFGKWFEGCDPCNTCGPRCGIEAVYFSTSPFSGSASVFAADPANNDWVSSTIDMNDQFGPIEFPDGNEVDDYFDNSLSQTITRRDYIQNVEINLLSQYWQPNAHCQVTWLAGVRWFRFNEDLLYSAVAGASTPTGSNQAFMSFDTNNDLVGFQLGARCDWYVTQRFSLFVTPKFGFYGNHIQTENRVYNGDGSTLYNFSQDTTGVSFLGELDLGASWQLTQHWRAFGGYRAIALTGVALSDNQIPHFLAAADELQTINRNGSLIVHGAFMGAEFCY